MDQQHQNKKIVEVGWSRPKTKAVIGIGVGVATIAIFAGYKLVKVWKNRFGGREKRGVEAKTGEKKEIGGGAPPFQRSIYVGELHGGKVAMQRILDACRAHAQRSLLADAEAELKEELEHKQLDFFELERIIGKLEMGGKEDYAMELLSKKRTDLKGKKYYHEVYEIEMLMVETLIYQGKFQDALNVESLKDDVITDARRPLYKAVIYTILDKKEEAEKSWKEFEKNRSEYEAPPIKLNMFQEAVGFLKKKIEDARASAK